MVPFQVTGSVLSGLLSPFCLQKLKRPLETPAADQVRVRQLV
jgi:hypothetical protein